MVAKRLLFNALLNFGTYLGGALLAQLRLAHFGT
jgi:hypothetical protein